MTTKKIIAIIVIVIVVIGIMVVLFAGGIVGVVFYSIGNSEAANTARAFLRTNDKLKEDIGEVNEFGSFVTGSINVQNGDGEARLNLKVIGARKTVNASVDLAYRAGHPWRVVNASYTNDKGQLIYLLNPYESKLFVIPLAA
ncbi:MAG TPA: cytochrome c oxidase assembly factor Coa1 family protein [Pyrinomonadaceae bacterium]|nr:cytochrome c oxidase assembly factor Coa1 family protein [Pyrinomonadaceae bacterium]